MADNPLVSIIVRTKDRPKLLRKALRSIAVQTYRPVEVVLVNDGGCDLDDDEIRGILGDVSLNYLRLGKNTGRAHAGNVGIENARGGYTGFLDDDDEFYPDHVGTLVSFLNQSGSMVAYTAVEFVEEICEGDPAQALRLPRGTFAKQFSYDDLLIGNYIPLISLLFRGDSLKSFMFDESFELYEDWDMLIRAGEAAPFYFINKITATYNQRDNSQIAFKSPPEVIRQATLKLYEKHRTKLPLELIFSMREENDRKNAVIAGQEKCLGTLEARIHNLETVLKEKDAYMQNLHSARGWRLLTRYYQIKDRLCRLMR
jgi:glycosyltransferase involved in cell wall biosynthesis